MAFSLRCRAILGDCAATGHKSVLWCPYCHSLAAEVRWELGEEVRPLLPENPRLRSDRTGSVLDTPLYPWFGKSATVYHPHETIQRDINRDNFCSSIQLSKQRLGSFQRDLFLSYVSDLKEFFFYLIKSNDCVEANELHRRFCDLRFTLAWNEL